MITRPVRHEARVVCTPVGCSVCELKQAVQAFAPRALLYIAALRPLPVCTRAALTYVTLLLIMPGNIINLTPADVLSWPKPNYVDPVRRTWMPIFAGITFGTATLMVAMRFWLRIRGHAGKLGLDDVSTA